MQSEEEAKMRVMGLLETGKSAREVARDESLPYPKVLAWRKEWQGVAEKQDVETILATDADVVHEIANDIKSRLEQTEGLSGELVDKVVDKVDKLMQLEGDMQDTGIALVKRINGMVDDVTAPIELEVLVTSLAKLQTAFFAKGANVNVLNAPGASFSDSGISSFKSMQRSS